MTNQPHINGIVLAGAAALGAYEVGVMSHVVEHVTREVDVTGPRVFSGTSAGAINATALAAFADDPANGIEQLARAWTGMQIDAVVRPSSVELLSMMFDLAGVSLRVRRALHCGKVRGGILDPLPIERLVARVPIARIREHLAAGRIRGLAISVTRVSTGAAVVFHEAAAPVEPWRPEENVTAFATSLTSSHVLASAAIPLLFPAIPIDSELYCDGGLRQMVPLSPAIHLGADRLLVVNPLPSVRREPVGDAKTMSSPLYLAGKALNALFADRVDVDLSRLNQTTEILRAGRRRFGPAFATELNAELVRGGGRPLRAIDAVCIEPSHDLGLLAADFVTSSAFRSRANGPAGRFMQRIADGDPRRTGDLLSYLMFDGNFSSLLIEAGRADARARHDELCELFSTAPAIEPARPTAV